VTALTPAVGAAVPRRGNALTRLLAELALRLTGWRFDGALPDLPKFLIIVAPHTSNWDFLVGVMAMYALGIRGTFLGKHTLFRWPLGPFMRFLGGVPVDRTSPADVVEQSVAFIARSERVIFVLSPEGTRRRLEKWKTGFWRLAHGASIPIVPVAFDFARRRFVLNPPFVTTGDLDADLTALRSHFRSAMALKPANYVE
jgi:1-acyl-sn-glycerol-3-phosphate acyltransferase